DATVKLITTAVREMASDPKVGRAEAMRRSMLSLIDKGAAHESHPAYWAPFVVVGEGAAVREVVFRRRRPLRPLKRALEGLQYASQLLKGRTIKQTGLQAPRPADNHPFRILGAERRQCDQQNLTHLVQLFQRVFAL